ncbi:TRAP transporter substrate-binding protein [Brevibacillus sp. B_LB10_24]|uniref:TRAP transporter substrate-binding protein n=1 Tax=Brevibacillus sp. B_LB10_24 TaxID=3380645 RepID=UPI0038B84E4F
MKSSWSKRLAYGFFIMVFLLLAGCGNQAAESNQQAGGAGKSQDSGKTYKFKLGFNTNEQSVRYEAAKKFKDAVEEKTNGRVEIQIFPSETLGTEQEMLESVKIGALDFQLAGGGSMTNILPQYGTLQLPFMINGYDEAYAVLDGPIGDRWKKEAEEFGYKVLAHADLGFAQITNNKHPIKSPEDIAGVKMRSPNEPTSIETFNQLGAITSTIPFSELYLALSQGVVDGQFNPLDAIYDQKFYEVQKYLAITNHFYYHINFIMNKGLWDSLDPELQTIIQDAANEARDLSRELTQKRNSEVLDSMKANFEEITEPDIAAFRAKVEPAYAKLADIVGKQNFEEVQKFLEEYRATHKK